MPVQVIAHPETGSVITASVNKPDYGTFRVDSVENTFKGGFMNRSKRTAFIRGLITNLESLNLRAGQTLPGKIIKRESFVPFFDGQNPKINPTTSEVVLTDGRETFLEYEYTTDIEAQDSWVAEPVTEVAPVAENATQQM